MSSRRILVAGVVAILALTIGAIAVIAFVSDAPVSRRASPSGAPEAERGAAPRPPSASSAPAVPAPPPLSAVAPTVAGAAPASGPRRPWAESSAPWREVPTSARPYELGAELARPVMAALEAARDQMTSCFDEEDRLLARGLGPRLDPADPPTGPAALVLLLETRAGGLDVVDSEVSRTGTSTQALIQCARHVLRGWPIAAPRAVPGRRYRLVYALR